jgi:hypothetical protein
LKDKGLLYAVGASIVAHGLALALGAVCQGLCWNRAPIEARLLQRGSLPRRPRRAALRTDSRPRRIGCRRSHLVR